MRRVLLYLVACIFAPVVAAAPISATGRAEIDALLSRLETSGCVFNRNGDWHSAAEAKSHLLRKLKYLEDKGAVQTAEQFIELAASHSSMTGQPYLVRCGGGAPETSGTWLLSQLRLVRSPGRAASGP